MRVPHWWRIAAWLRQRPERLAWWVAWQLPRRVALFAFVRVYAVLGECGPDYARVYDAWERRR
jgi:hypothetical protein